MKILLRVFLLIFVVSIVSGCADNDEEVHSISNRFFSQEMLVVMLDTENFIGRTISYEGSFMHSTCDITGDAFYYIVQFGDDCCAPGETLGFEVYLNDIPSVAQFTWVEVIGVLEEVSIDGLGDVLRLNAVSMHPVTEMRP